METNITLTVHDILAETFILLDEADRRALTPLNLTIRQYYVLYHLGNNSGLNIRDLSARLLCDKSTTTRLVEKMRQSGLLCRNPDPNDRRYVVINLTEEGRALREQAIQIHYANIDQKLQHLSTQELELLKTTLQKLRNNLLLQLGYVESAEK